MPSVYAQFLALNIHEINILLTHSNPRTRGRNVGTLRKRAFGAIKMLYFGENVKMRPHPLKIESAGLGARSQQFDELFAGAIACRQLLLLAGVVEFARTHPEFIRAALFSICAAHPPSEEAGPSM